MSPLARRLVEELQAQPRQFGELVEAHMDVAWRDFLLAWGEVRAADVLMRDDAGRYLIPNDATSAPSPSPSTDRATP